MSERKRVSRYTHSVSPSHHQIVDFPKDLLDNLSSLMTTLQAEAQFASITVPNQVEREGEGREYVNERERRRGGRRGVERERERFQLTYAVKGWMGENETVFWFALVSLIYF